MTHPRGRRGPLRAHPCADTSGNITDMFQEKLMHYPRYEFVIPREHERCPTGRRPRPRPDRPERTTRPAWKRPTLRRIARLREPRPQLAIHEYLELEFTVED